MLIGVDQPKCIHFMLSDAPILKMYFENKKYIRMATSWKNSVDGTIGTLQHCYGKCWTCILCTHTHWSARCTITSLPSNRHYFKPACISSVFAPLILKAIDMHTSTTNISIWIFQVSKHKLECKMGFLPLKWLRLFELEHQIHNQNSNCQSYDLDPTNLKIIVNTSWVIWQYRNWIIYLYDFTLKCNLPC